MPEIARVGTYYVPKHREQPPGVPGHLPLCGPGPSLHLPPPDVPWPRGTCPRRTTRGDLTGWPSTPTAPGWGIPSPWTPPVSPAPTWSLASGPGDGGSRVSHGLPTPPWRWADYDPAGYLAYVHLAGDQALSAEAIEAFYRQTAEDLDLPVPGFSNVYFRYHDSSYLREVLPMVLVLGALVLAGAAW